MVSPKSSTNYGSRDNVALSAYSFDSEEGDLSSRIVWFVNNVEVGVGANINHVFSAGQHIVTAKVNDSSKLGSRTTTKSVTINVDEALSKTVLIYINGMMNFEITESVIALDIMKKKFISEAKKRNELDDIVETIHVFNPVSWGTLAQQLNDVLEQKSIELSVSHKSLSQRLLDIMSYCLLCKDAPNTVELLDDIRVMSLLFNQNIMNTSVNELALKKIHQAINDNARILLIGHSQGNFYVNRAYSNLSDSDKKYIGILALASPSNYLGLPTITQPSLVGSWVTLENDKVIGKIPFTLPSNILNSTQYIASNKDSRHHAIIESYLNGDNSGPLIQEKMIYSLGRSIGKYQ